MTDPARMAATERYTAAEARLRKAARQAERTGRPTLAQELRRKADYAYRAALAEEIDEKPGGLP